jgi:hypothetical protein
MTASMVHVTTPTHPGVTTTLSLGRGVRLRRGGRLLARAAMGASYRVPLGRRYLHLRGGRGASGRAQVGRCSRVPVVGLNTS